MMNLKTLSFLRVGIFRLRIVRQNGYMKINHAGFHPNGIISV